VAGAHALTCDAPIRLFPAVHTASMERADVARELGHFLRTRRERLGPDGDDGIRRTRGLRREEVAEKAAVSREYYTKLEQGRALNPSPEVLEAVGSALLLSPDEVTYVQDLATLLRSASPAPDAHDMPDDVGARLVDAITDRPAWVVDHRLDITSWNAMSSELLIDFAEVPRDERNLTWLMLTHPVLRSRCVHWEEAVRQNVALLRGGAGRHPNDQRIVGLVAELSTRSSDFARLWESHDVLGRNHGARVFEHPRAGRFELHYDAVHLPGPSDRHLTVYSPRDAEGDRALSVLRALRQERRRP
jgi:transcriptional regulator with XRE-family HTH domain